MWAFFCPRQRKPSDRGDCRRTRTSPRKRATVRPGLEALEGRWLPSFSAPTYYPAGAAPQAVVTADLNGDGKLDLVTANQGTYDSTGTYVGGGVSVLLGTTVVKKGSTVSSFTPAQSYDVGPTNAVVVGDVNRDGKPDIVAGNGGVLLNNGDGTFRAGPGVAGGVGMYPTLTDVNGDGKPDLIAFNSYSTATSTSTIRILPGNGDGTFQAGSTYAIPYYLRSVLVGNFNADGKPDLIAANAYSLFLLPGNGDGTFGAAQTIPASFGGDEILGVVAARFNADANLDLAVALLPVGSTASNTPVEFLLGNGDGTFRGDSRSYGLDVQAGSFAGMAAADITHDGKMDLLAVGSWGGVPTISVLPGNGDGTFGAAQDFQAATGGATVASPTSLTIGDFNGDGYLDVAVAGQGATVGAGYGIDVYLWSPKKK